MSEERIQRILARAGVVSRRGAKELLREGRVTVNGQVAEIGGKADPEKDAIKVDGRRVQPHVGPHHYLLLNKPKGVLSTVSDPEGRTTVVDLVPPVFRKALVPVGRLDYNTEGLILLTDDGELAQHVAHPRYGGVKTYEVKVKGRPSEEELDRLRAGISLEGRRTAPARITPRHAAGQGDRRRGKRRPSEKAQKGQKTEKDEGENTWWIVELMEGRTRQIREMFFRIGHPVQKLRRVAIGPLRDPDLPVGAVRELTEREVELLRRVTARPKPRPKPQPEAKLRPKAQSQPQPKPKPKAKTAAAPRATPGRHGPGEGAQPRRGGAAPPARGRGTSRPAAAEGPRRPARPGQPGTSAPGRPGRAAPGRPGRAAAPGRAGRSAPGRKPAGGPRRGGAGGARRPPRGRGGGS